MNKKVRKKKLTLVVISGQAVFVKCPVDSKGKVRISWDDLGRIFGYKRGNCIRIGS